MASAVSGTGPNVLERRRKGIGTGQSLALTRGFACWLFVCWACLFVRNICLFVFVFVCCVYLFLAHHWAVCSTDRGFVEGQDHCTGQLVRLLGLSCLFVVFVYLFVCCIYLFLAHHRAVLRVRIIALGSQSRREIRRRTA